MSIKVEELMTKSVITAQPHQSVEHVRPAQTGGKPPLRGQKRADTIEAQRRKTPLGIFMECRVVLTPGDSRI